MFYEEIRIKQGLSNISFCPLRILYNSKFIIIATSLGTNAVVVTRVHCISEYCLKICVLCIFQAAKSLNSMLGECIAEIPADLRSSTPITLKATAGLRLLPAGQADNILNEVSMLHLPNLYHCLGKFSR